MLEAIDPFGERRADLRFAVQTALLIQVAGGKKKDGTPFTAADVLTHLNFEAPPPSPAPTQTATEIEARLRMWVSGSNQIMKQPQARKGRR